MGLAVDICNKMPDEKLTAAKLLSSGEDEDRFSIAHNIVQDFEKTKHLLFLKNRKYAPLFKEALGKKLKDITSHEDNVSTRVEIDELVTVRAEPNKDGPQLFPRTRNGVKMGKNDYFS